MVDDCFSGEITSGTPRAAMLIVMSTLNFRSLLKVDQIALTLGRASVLDAQDSWVWLYD
jgi:hypothetical protein